MSTKIKLTNNNNGKVLMDHENAQVCICIAIYPSKEKDTNETQIIENANCSLNDLIHAYRAVKKVEKNLNQKIFQALEECAEQTSFDER